MQEALTRMHLANTANRFLSKYRAKHASESEANFPEALWNSLKKQKETKTTKKFLL